MLVVEVNPHVGQFFLIEQGIVRNWAINQSGCCMAPPFTYFAHSSLFNNNISVYKNVWWKIMNQRIKSYLYKMSVNFSTFVTSKIFLYCCCTEMKKSMKKDIILQIRYSKVKIKFRLEFFILGWFSMSLNVS